MILYPNAKINIGLHITTKRPDGYHSIETAFVPVPWKDALEIIPTDAPTSFQSTGIPIPGKSETNLCLRAHAILQKTYGIPNVSIHLHKAIPIGAGLGGGSSDAAFTIKALNQLFQLELDLPTMETIARPLGSDCAFFIHNKAVLGYGKGDEFQPFTFPDFSNYSIVLIYPNIHISTPDAYAGVTPKQPNQPLAEVLRMPINEWKWNVKNDFEQSIFVQHPILETIKLELYSMNAVYAAMSGSGSCMFGLFEHLPELPQVWKNTYTIFSSKL